MSRLQKQLREWVEQGFITSEQSQRIYDHESTRPVSSWFLSGLLSLGAIVIGIGVISLIANNWSQIPDSVKLLGDFALLAILAFFTFLSWQAKRDLQFEILLLLFILLCLASIGLISQIYHTGGKPYEALLLWSIITSGAALAARGKLVPFLWTGALLDSLAWAAFEAPAMQAIFGRAPPAILMALPLLCVLLTVACRRFAGDSGPVQAFRSWTMISGLLALLGAELFSHSWNFPGTMSLHTYIPGYILASVAIAITWVSKEYQRVQKMLLTLTAGVFLLTFHLPLISKPSGITSAVATIMTLGLTAFLMASLNERRLFQQLLFFVGLRFLVLYFQAFGGLARTGFGLIISGTFVIALTVLWNKSRTALSIWAERIVK